MSEETPHERYVRTGGCPYTHEKTWCNGAAGHFGVHWARRVLPNCIGEPANTWTGTERVPLPSPRGVGGEVRHHEPSN